MATQLKTFDWETERVASKYPWDKWLNGKPWKLCRGRDFQHAADAFRGPIWAAARRRGLVARVAKLDDKTLVVQAFNLCAGK